ncbi:MAG: M24 family metallopeptidase [Candidatus Kariarchaeum pelagius]
MIQIPKTELENRNALLKQAMLKSGINAVFLPLGIYFQYYFGKSASPSERIIMGVIPSDGVSFILTPTFEKSNLMKSTYVEDYITWDETESPYKKFSKELSDRNIGNNILVDPKLWISEVEKINTYSDLNILSGHDLLKTQREIKSEWEIKQLKRASKASAEGILASLPYLKEGITEKEFLPILSDQTRNLSNNPLSFALIQFGDNSSIPHGYPSSKKLKNDNVVLIDSGTSINGYQGDITISIPFGKPKQFEEIYQIVYDANRSALNNGSINNTGNELDQLARSHISNKNYGDYFTHRLGHGIGLEVHEEPYIVGNNNYNLKIGNCHTIEPGIYLPNKFGIRIEDDVVVTKNGIELLYDTPRFNFDYI